MQFTIQLARGKGTHISSASHNKITFYPLHIWYDSLTHIVSCI